MCVCHLYIYALYEVTEGGLIAFDRERELEVKAKKKKRKRKRKRKDADDLDEY